MHFSLKTMTDRATAVFLFILLMEISVAVALGVGSLRDYHFYAPDYREYAVQEAFAVKSETDVDSLSRYAVLRQKDENTLSEIERTELRKLSTRFSPDNADATNLRFLILRDDGTALTNLKNGETMDDMSFIYSRYDVVTTYDMQGASRQLRIAVGVLPDLAARDAYRTVYRLIRVAIGIRYPIVLLLIVTAVLALLILGALMSSIEVTDANGNEKKESFIDRIPLDVLIVMLLFIFGFFGVLVALTAVADVKSTNLVLWNAIILIISFFLSVVALVFNLSVASRIKRGHVYRNTLVFRLIARIRKLAGKENEGYFKVPFIGKAMLTVGLAMLAELIVLLYFVYAYVTNASGLLSDFKFGYYVCFWAAGRFILIPVFVMMALNLNKLRENGERLAEGDYQFDVDSHIMFGDFRQINANLNKIQGEMMEAAEEKNRSYRLRSELITNISHDIKTPLTSIVNYVDLLRHTEASSAQTAEYLDVLQTQSVKLKKLLENLIEVSKLTTGDISVQMDTLDLVMFTQQSASEFEDKLNAAGLTLVQRYDENEMQVAADGDKLWRVFENLFGNILKYAQRGTRVYLDVARDGDRVRVTLKNTAGEQLHVSGEELMHRFVRADTSRHTDGYGLGLSIARSLTQIQRGTFDVHVDGDLFRVDMTFERA